MLIHLPFRLEHLEPVFPVLAYGQVYDESVYRRFTRVLQFANNERGSIFIVLFQSLEGAPNDARSALARIGRRECLRLRRLDIARGQGKRRRMAGLIALV
jgi:hypothetical protein